jgi:HEAT repeat protein
MTTTMSRGARILCAALLLMAAPRAGAQQVAFEAVVRDLSSPQVDVRLRAVRLLKESGYTEAARPLAAVLTDPDDRVQLEAIAAVLNTFFAELVDSRRRVALIVELRSRISAEEAFDAGPPVLGGQPVPREVLEGLRLALDDENAVVAREALFALGTLGNEATGGDHRELLARAGPQLAALLGHPDAARRVAAARVIGRLFVHRPTGAQAPPAVGDAVIGALNDNVPEVKAAAMDALGAMRYERSVDALVQLFDFYGSGALAERAFDAVAHIGHPGSVPLFYQQLSDGNARLRTMAIEGLARTGNVGTLTTLQSALGRNRNEAVSLAGDFAAVGLAKGSVDVLVNALTRTRLRDQSFAYVIELAPGRAKEFAGGLQHPNARVRADIVHALGLSGDPDAQALVEPMTRDPDRQVARAAEIAAARLRRDGR